MEPASLDARISRGSPGTPPARRAYASHGQPGWPLDPEGMHLPTRIADEEHALQPLAGSFLCVASVPATPSALFSRGSAPDDCSGSLALDFNAWIAAGGDARLFAGATVWAQFWCRDPGSPLGHLSNALTFQVGH